jgi:tetratricopeptide (TPR) repeat protein
MKKFFLFVLASLFLLSAICLDVSAAKKSSKISKEAVQQMSDDIDNITKKIYARALLSPKDNETLIGIKIQLDNQMLVSSATELAPLYYKAGNIYKLRGMKTEAIECYQTVLENFSDTALAPKARTALEDLGITVTAPVETEESGEDI